MAAGANVIFTTLALDDVASKYLVQKKVMGLRRMDKKEMKRLARATGATIVTSFANQDGTESFGEDLLGKADSVYEENLGDQDYIFVENPAQENHKISTLVLRGANEHFLDEVERSLHDSLCVLKRTLESGKVVVGGGCVETAVAVFLENMAHKSTSKDLSVIAEFAEALMVIPRQIALNAALDSIDLTAKLQVMHQHYQENQDEKFKSFRFGGLDLVKGSVGNNLENGVLEPMVCKTKMLKFATEAAIAILRIDDMIKLAPE